MIDHDLILDAMASGRSLRSICAENGWPESTARKQVADDEALHARYARARELQADHYADRISDDATDPSIDPAEKRARIDALKWVAGKLRPNRYGDRQVLAGDPEAPLLPASDAQLAEWAERAARVAQKKVTVRG